MVADGIRIKLIGLQKAIQKLMLMKRQFQDPKPLYDKAIIILEQSHMKTFKQEGRPKWTKSQRVEKYGGKTLQSTTGPVPGLLMKSVTGRSSKAIREHRGMKLHFGTKLIYAPSHQFGYKPRGIPPRPFLGVYDEDRKRLNVVFQKDLTMRLKVVGKVG